ncbi:hypothetical protein BH09ACT6_BH09ACT6_12070 [soil metagenome]
MTTADVGSTLTVTVTGSQIGITSVSRTSAAASKVLNIFTATPTPTISGTATVGKKLTAATGTWMPAPTTFTYQWKSSGTLIWRATSSTYSLVAADAGKKAHRDGDRHSLWLPVGVEDQYADGELLLIFPFEGS